VFENRVLRRIFGPKWDEITGEWKKKCIMRTFVIWNIQVAEDEMAGPCSTNGG
jgi:hypothetical protein